MARDNSRQVERQSVELTLTRKSSVPLYRQIVDQVGELIRSGALQPGERLPTVRQLAAAYQLTRLTVQSAYAELQAADLIQSHVGRGTFVSPGHEHQSRSRVARGTPS